jgi:hypothetical protein
MNRPASRELRTENLVLDENQKKDNQMQFGVPGASVRWLSAFGEFTSTFNVWMWRGLEILLSSPQKPSGFLAE